MAILDVSTVYISGNTIRLLCRFSDFDGNVVSPQLVKVKLYNTKYDKTDEFTVNLENKTQDGYYFFDYTTPYTTTGLNMYYEWYGEINGTIAIDRRPLAVKFAR